MTTRSCTCPHRFPLCGCHEGLTGHALNRRSNQLSAPTGWPSPRLDAKVIEAHQAVVAEARRQQAQDAAQARRAAKPRVPLGVKLGSPACGPCNAPRDP